jgi:hypothetical protein
MKTLVSAKSVAKRNYHKIPYEKELATATEQTPKWN